MALSAAGAAASLHLNPARKRTIPTASVDKPRIDVCGTDKRGNNADHNHFADTVGSPGGES